MNASADLVFLIAASPQGRWRMYGTAQGYMIDGPRRGDWSDGERSAVWRLCRYDGWATTAEEPSRLSLLCPPPRAPHPPRRSGAVEAEVPAAG